MLARTTAALTAITDGSAQSDAAACAKVSAVPSAARTAAIYMFLTICTSLLHWFSCRVHATRFGLRQQLWAAACSRINPVCCSCVLSPQTLAFEAADSRLLEYYKFLQVLLACMHMRPHRAAFPGLAAPLLARINDPCMRIDDPSTRIDNPVTSIDDPCAHIDDPAGAGRAASAVSRVRADALRRRAAALQSGTGSGERPAMTQHIGTHGSSSNRHRTDPHCSLLRTKFFLGD